MAASRRRVIPIAHSGASCGSRELLSVSRLVSSATPATPSVKAFSAAVTAKVRLKIRVDSVFSVAWSARLRPSRPNLCLNRRDQRGHRGGRDAQAQSRLRDVGKVPHQRIDIDADLAFRIAVVGIDRRRLRAASVRDGVGTCKRSPRPSLMRRANCSLISAASPPRRRSHDVGGGLQQRPVVAIGRVIGETENLDRPAADLHVGPAARQDRLDFRALAQPRLDLRGLRVVGGIEIDVRRQPAVEPAGKSLAETFHHGADADIDRQRQQQRHQAPATSPTIAAGCRPRTMSPAGGACCARRAKARSRASPAGPAPRRAATPPARQIPTISESPNHRKQRRRRTPTMRKRALQQQPAMLRLLPGIGLRGREDREAGPP